MSLRLSISWPASSITHAGPICILGQFCVWRSLHFWPAQFDGNGKGASTWPSVRSQLETHEPGLGLIWHWLRHLSATFQKQFARHKSLKCPNSFETEQFDLSATKYIVYSSSNYYSLIFLYTISIYYKLYVRSTVCEVNRLR